MSTERQRLSEIQRNLSENHQLLRFVQDLQTIRYGFVTRNIAYACVGGVAVNAILEKGIQHRRHNGTIPDFDAIAFEPEMRKLERLDLHFAGIRELDPNFPEVGIEPVIYHKPRKASFLELLSSLAVDEPGKVSLVYRDITEDIPAEDFRIIERISEGVVIPTFTAEMTYWRYFARGGAVKPKDVAKISDLAQFALTHPEERMSQEGKLAHTRFLERIAGEYPLQLATYKAYWNLDRFLGDRISGKGGVLYDAIRLFRRG